MQVSKFSFIKYYMYKPTKVRTFQVTPNCNEGIFKSKIYLPLSFYCQNHNIFYSNDELN